VTGRHRVTVAALALLAILLGMVLVAFAGNACPAATPTNPCPQAGTNRVIVVGLAAGASGLLVMPFAFLAEFLLRRRIVYRGAWGRAVRRGLLVAAAVAAVAGLRLGGALSVPVGIFVALLASLVEWLAIRRFDVA
jgi:hypothetical protein